MRQTKAILAAMRRSLLSLFILGLCAPFAPAWNAAGHMVHGALAYSILKRDSPEALANVVALLKQHPEDASRWAKKLNESFVKEYERDLYLFMLAARWADDVRKNREYDRPTWHYINFPIKPDATPDSVQAKPPASANILRALQTN